MNLRDIKIPTWTEPRTLEFLAAAAQQVDYAVDLGCYIGASAQVMLRANPKLHLWTVDHFQAFAFNQEVAAIFLAPYIAEGRCEIIVGDSSRAAEMLGHMRGKIGLCFVDDGHATEQVLADIRYMLPLLCSHGTLCGHDFDVPHNDVAQGVIKSGISFDVPVPRLWRHIKP